MGSEYSIQLFAGQYDWKPLPQKQGDYQCSISEIMLDQTTKTKANYYQIAIYNDTPYQLQLISKHKNVTHMNVLHLIDAKIKSKTLLDCSNADIFQVYTQVIHHRFNQTTFGQLQYLIILKQILEACQILIKLCGAYFKMSEKMIGFTPQGVTKIWLNQHFGRNEIDPNNLLRNQEDMIKSILNIFAFKLGKKYNFFQVVTFERLKPALLQAIQQQTIIMNQSKTISKTNISIGISLKETNILNKMKITKIKRTSIDMKIPTISGENFFTKELIRSKQNQQNIKIQSRKTCQANNLSKSIKFSLANPLKNSQIFNSIIIPNRSFIKKPVIRINYDISPVNLHKTLDSQDYSELDHSFTQFPKQQSQNNITADLCKSRMNNFSALRTKYRKCSQITQRSEEDSEYSQYYSNQNSQYNQYNRKNEVNKKSLFFDTL